MHKSFGGRAENWRDPNSVEQYLSREIPHRETAEEMLLEALPTRIGRFADLGTGDGRLIAVVRGAHPAAAAVGLDFSLPMLDHATRRFAGDPLVELREHDLVERLPLDGSFDAVVSALAIHHLEDERKRSLFSEIRGLLAPDGVFVNLDLVTAATDTEHRRFRHAVGRAEDDPADRLADLCDQLSWLRQAGFQEVDCHFKWLQLTLIVARGPGATNGPKAAPS